MAVKYGLTKEEQEEFRAARAQNAAGSGAQEQSQNSRFDRTTNRMRYGLSEAERQYFSENRSDKRKAEILQTNQSAGWRETSYTKAREKTASAYDSYNSLVEDYQALFDKDKKLRIDKADQKTISDLLSRADELYKKGASGTRSGVKALQESLRSIQARNVMISAAIPDSVERAIGNAEKKTAKIRAGAAAIPGLPGDGMRIPTEDRMRLSETPSTVDKRKNEENQEMTVEEAGQRYREISDRLTELNRSGRTYGAMQQGGVYTPEAEKERETLLEEQNQLSQYIRKLSMENAMQHDSSYWARKASHEEERLREANAYRSGYGGVMQSGVMPDAGKQQHAEDIQRAFDEAKEYYYYTKNAEDWNRMTPELQEMAMEAAGLDISGVFDWLEGDATGQSGLAPDQRADQSMENRNRLNQIRQEITNAGFDADQIIEYANRMRNEQKVQEETQRMEEFGTGSVAGGIAATAATYGANLLSGIGSVGLLAQRVFGSGKGITDYRPVDYNVPSTAFSQVTQQTRQAIGGQMGETGQFFYNALNSAVDSAARMLVGQAIGNGFLTEAVSQEAIDRMNRIVSGAVSAQMNAQVFTDAFISAKQSGATDDDAILDAIVQAAIEGITEKYSVDEILKNPKQLTWTALRNSFLAEGSEEIASDVLNTMYDELKNGSNSELRSEAQAYIDAGIGAAEAWTRVLGSYAKQIVLDGLAGGLSGLAMGAASEVSRTQEYKQFFSDVESGQALVDEAMELNPESLTAIAAQDRLERGKPITAFQAANLTEMNNAAVTELEAQEKREAEQKAEADRQQIRTMDEQYRTEQTKAPKLTVTQQETGRTAQTVRNSAQMTVKTGKAGTSVRGTDVVKAVKIGDNDIVIQKTDGSTASINTLDQRGTALEVLQFAKEMPDYRDTMTVNGMMRDYETYLGNSGGNRTIAERFFDNYVIAVAGGAEGESLADVIGVTTSRRMQAAMEHGWRRGVEIAKGRRASKEMGSAGQAAMERYGYLYPQMFSDFYRAGQQGATFQQAMEAAGVKSLGEIKKAEMKAAWKAGRKDGTDYEGNALSDGSGEWETSMDSEEPVVGVEPGAEEADTSAAELGVEGGSIRKTVKVLQDRDLTPEMKTLRETAKEAGVEVTFIRGYLEIQSNGETYKARGAHMGNRIIVKVDDKKATFQKIYRHEWLHHQIDAGAVKLEDAIQTVKNAVGADVWEAQTPKYRQAYVGVYLNRRADFANLVAEEMCADAYAGLFPGSDAVEIRGAEIEQKNSAQEGARIVKFSKQGERIELDRGEKGASIREQIRRSADILNKMDSVADVKTENLAEMNIKQQRKWAEDTLRKTGYRIERNGFGVIKFDEKMINTGLNYLDTPGEVAAFAALPRVLKRGIVIEDRGRHKNRNNGSITLAAPVKINGIRGNMAAVVTISQKDNRYHTHRILMPDGSEFIFEIEKTDTSSKPERGVTAESGSLANPIEPVSNISITQGQAESQEGKLSIMEPESSAEYKQYMGRVGGRTPQSSSEYAEIQRRQEKLYDHMVKRQFELRRQMSEGTEKQPTRETVAAVAQEILKITGPNAMSRGMLSERIEQIAMNAARETNRMEAYRKAKEETDLLAADLVRGATGRTEKATRDWDGIRAVFRSGGKPVKLFIDGANRMDLESEGGYEGMRKRLMGYAFLSSGGVPVGDFYKTLAEKYPDYFPDTLNRQADQLIQIAKVLDRFRSIFKSPYEGELATATEYISNEILQKLYNNLTTSPGAEAYAEQHEDMLRAYYQQKIKELKANHQDQVEQMKREYAAKRQQERESQKTAREERALRTELLHMAQRLSRIKVGSQWKDEADYLIGQLDTISKRMTGCTIVGEYIGNISSEGIEVKEYKKNGKKLVNLVDLKNWVDNMLKENPNFRPDAATMKKLQRLDRTSIDDLTMPQVRNLLNAMSNLEHEIEYSNKLIRTEEKREITVLSSIVRSDIEAAGGVTPASVEKFLSDYITTQSLSPIRFMKRITGYKESDPLYRAALELQRGETKMIDFRRRAEEKFKSFRDNQKFMESLSGKKSEAIEITGRTENGIQTLRITPDMRIAIYLHSRNDDNINHAELGGMLIPDYDLLMRGHTEEAYENGKVMYLTKRQMQQIANGMKPMERNYANAIWEYYNVFAKEELNAVSRDLIGYDRATVRNYYPIEVGQDYRMGDPTEIPGTPSAANPGNLKERTGAATTINLRGATETLMKSIDMNAKYIGLAIPVRNFGKLYGNTTWFVAYDNNDAGWMQEDEREKQTVVSSVQAVLNRTWGAKAGKYIDKLLKDIQTQSFTEDDYAKGMDKIRSNYAGAVLTLNFSVAMKQAASYPTAAAVVGWKALGKAMTNWQKTDLDLVAKYTPLLWYRSKGYSTKELGDLAKGNKSLPKYLNWIQGIDIATTKKLWKAAEYYIRDNQKELTIGSEDYYKAVAEVYNRIILETQPNYTTMERPQALRSDSDMVKNMMMFKTQPMQNLNIAYDAIANLRAKERQLKAARDAARNDPAASEWVKEAERAVKQAKTDFGNSISALLASAVVFAGMTLAWNALRGKTSKYKDDDDEWTVKTFLAGFGNDILSSFTGMIPFGSDIHGVIQSLITDEKYYGLEAMAPSAISDFLEKVVKIPDNYKDIKGAFNGDVPVGDVVWSVNDLITSLTKLITVKGFSVPVENIENSAKMMMLNVMRIGTAAKLKTAEEADYWYRYYTTKTTASNRRSQDYADIYESAKAGNMDGYQEMRDKMEGWIWKENDSYQSGEISRDEAMERATETVDGAMKERIQEEFLDGTMKEEKAKKLLTEIAGFDKDDQKKLDETVLNWACEKDTGIKYDDLRDAYLNGEISGKRAAEYLAKYGWHEADMDEEAITEEAEATVRKWEYQSLSGDSNAGVKQADQYYELAKPAGISMEVYNEFYNWQSKQSSDKDEDGKDIKGQTKKDKVVAYIDGLDLSDNQKDALFLTLYKESGLKDTPWQ